MQEKEGKCEREKDKNERAKLGQTGQEKIRQDKEENAVL